jgi:uncharacterized OB-fold protein
MSEVLQPVSDERSAPFFDGAREGRLMLQHCTACGAWLYPVRTRCTSCQQTTLEWKESSGRGVVYSHGRPHRLPPGLETRMPITLVVVDLEEGVRMSSNLIDADPARVRAGMPVEVAFEKLSEESTLPVFRPSGS